MFASMLRICARHVWRGRFRWSSLPSFFVSVRFVFGSFLFRFGSVRSVLFRFGSVWFGSVRFDSVRFIFFGSFCFVPVRIISFRFIFFRFVLCCFGPVCFCAALQVQLPTDELRVELPLLQVGQLGRSALPLRLLDRWALFDTYSSWSCYYGDT